MERVFGKGRGGRGGKAIETGRMVKKKGSRKQECNRKLGERRGDTGRDGAGEAGRKGSEKTVPRMGEGRRTLVSQTLLWVPLKTPQALGTSILGVWRKKGSTFSQVGREGMAGNCPLP